MENVKSLRMNMAEINKSTMDNKNVNFPFLESLNLMNCCYKGEEFV